MKKNLFIAGCARSGTSALVQLLSGSEDIVLGMERYGHLVKKNDFKLTKEHFVKERFFDLREEDTFYSDFFAFHRFSPNIEAKFDSCKWVGDKRPDLYEVYDELFEAFPESKVIFIYRDIVEVASSYQERVKDGKNWPASKDFMAAVREWNRSLYLTREAIAKGYDINVVEYSSIFNSKKDLNPLFEILNIDIDKNLERHIANIRGRATQLVEERKMSLSESELDYISKNSKSFLIDNIVEKKVL
ncbi:sulfotransferase family protein [Shewanella waksmanii]|uniref:sulfotransferase family protein n=1 Tax=Shewanella waksmanii TaxID=213783 RepID=UPI003736F60D